MLGNPKILSARRAYTFAADAIQISALITAEVQGRVRSAFNFQTSGMGTPMQTFGPVASALPPGLVFDWGSIVSDAGGLTPIRFIHFEPTRIVIDVTGPSGEIDRVYQRLREILDSVPLTGGGSILADAEHVADYSELLPVFEAHIERLLSLPVRELVKHRLLQPSNDVIFVPGFVFQAARSQEHYAGAVGSDQYVLQLRAGTRPADGVLFSAAPLSTEDHRSYLEGLEHVLLQSP